MSRYVLPTEVSNVECVVGYDPPLQTYFAIVKEKSVVDGIDDKMLVWRGTTTNEIRSPQDLVKHVKRYASIPDEILSRLMADKLSAPEPTQLQKAVRGLFNPLPPKPSGV